MWSLPSSTEGRCRVGSQPGYSLHLRTCLLLWGCAHLTKTRVILAPLRPYFWEPFPPEFLIVILELSELCISLDSISAFYNSGESQHWGFASIHTATVCGSLIPWASVDDSSASKFMNHIKISNFIRASRLSGAQYNLY